MKLFAWNDEKNVWLKNERQISFEEIALAIEWGFLLDILERPNPEKYPGQRIFVVQIEDYVYLVPFVENENEVFVENDHSQSQSNPQVLERKRAMSDLKLQPDELELLASYENEEWQSVKNVREQAAQYQAYARATFRKDRRVNIRISERDLLALQRRALREGIPYQTLIASILHKYVTGALSER